MMSSAHNHNHHVGHQLHHISSVYSNTSASSVIGGGGGIAGTSASSFANVTNTTAYDAPKRTRFSFKPEHLVVSVLYFSYCNTNEKLINIIYVFVCECAFIV